MFPGSGSTILTDAWTNLNTIMTSGSITTAMAVLMGLWAALQFLHGFMEAWDPLGENLTRWTNSNTPKTTNDLDEDTFEAYEGEAQPQRYRIKLSGTIYK